MNQEEYEEKHEAKIERALDTVYGRNRGGQPGNQNARTHGLYSRHLTPEQQESMKAAACVRTLDDEIALMRLKIMDIFNKDPDNHAAMLMAVNTLTKMLRTNIELKQYSSMWDRGI